MDIESTPRPDGAYVQVSAPDGLWVVLRIDGEDADPVDLTGRAADLAVIGLLLSASRGAGSEDGQVSLGELVVSDGEISGVFRGSDGQERQLDRDGFAEAVTVGIAGVLGAAAGGAPLP